MEKRNYVKPNIGCNYINTASFIAGSKDVYDDPDEIITLVNNLDNCFQFNGTVTDTALKTAIGKGNSVCVVTAEPESFGGGGGHHGQGNTSTSTEVCNITEYQTVGRYYTLSYVEIKKANGEIVEGFTLEGPVASCTHTLLTKVN